MMKRLSLTKILILCFAGIILLGFSVPERLVIPVHGATKNDWNHNTFWYSPWGVSGVHRGIDIFGSAGTPVIASTFGIVVYKGEAAIGGKILIVLGPKWRIHFYTHLQDYNVNWGSIVSRAEHIGFVGASGNAKGKPPHLHYAIFSLIPYPWLWDAAPQGWKKMFFLNPGSKLIGKNPV